MAKFLIFARSFIICILVLCVHIRNGSFAQEESEGNNLGESADEGGTENDFVWTYQNQDDWFMGYPMCSMDNKRQSPINIPTKQVEVNRDYRLRLINYNQYITFKAKNTQDTVNLDPMQPRRFPIVAPRWLPGKQFELRDIHFHWGEEQGCGSEHRVDNKSSKIEAHFVHYLKGVSEEAAPQTPGSILVIGVFIDEAKNYNEINKEFDDAISYFSQVDGENSSSCEFILPVMKNPFLFLAREASSRFYAYNGSLTTPPCAAVVNWVVLDRHVKISKEQIDLLINIKTRESNGEIVKIGPNHLQLQRLNERPIVASFKPRNTNLNKDKQQFRLSELISASTTTSTSNKEREMLGNPPPRKQPIFPQSTTLSQNANKLGMEEHTRMEVNVIVELIQRDRDTNDNDDNQVGDDYYDPYGGNDENNFGYYDYDRSSQ